MFVNNTIKKGFELFLKHIENNNPFDNILCQNLLYDLKNSTNGLINLKETYSDDIMFICKIDALIEEINARLIEINNKHNMSCIKNDFEEKEKNLL
jgi:hypothetical protein